MSEPRDTPADGDAAVNASVGAAAERIRRALESDDAGRVAGPGAKHEDRPKGAAGGQDSEDEPPAADAVAP